MFAIFSKFFWFWRPGVLTAWGPDGLGSWQLGVRKSAIRRTCNTANLQFSESSKSAIQRIQPTSDSKSDSTLSSIKIKIRNKIRLEINIKIKNKIDFKIRIKPRFEIRFKVRFKIRFTIRKQRLKLIRSSVYTKNAYKKDRTWICAGPL